MCTVEFFEFSIQCVVDRLDTCLLLLGPDDLRFTQTNVEQIRSVDIVDQRYANIFDADLNMLTGRVD
jgi:hypothetical protein